MARTREQGRIAELPNSAPIPSRAGGGAAALGTGRGNAARLDQLRLAQAILQPTHASTDPASGRTNTPRPLDPRVKRGVEAFEGSHAAHRSEILEIQQAVWEGRLTDPREFGRRMASFEALAASREAAQTGAPEDAPLAIEGRDPVEHYTALFDRVKAGETIPISDANWLNRGIGLLQTIGGVGEMVLGGLGLAAPTGVTQVAGGLLALHGADTLSTGLATMWTGEVQDTLTADGITAAAEGLGASPDTAENIGDYSDAGLGIIGSLGVGGLLGASDDAVRIGMTESVESSVDNVVGSSADNVVGSTADDIGGLSDDVGRSVDSATSGASSTTPVSSQVGGDYANRLIHIFGNARHNLGGLVQHYGSEKAAYDAMQSAIESAVRTKHLTGVFETVISLAGSNVTVRGAVVNGAVKIATAFIR